ncbi:MAG: hypothetical protein LBE12_12895 [Planctomycetaceae bacterium]|jgi:hypothetical protein|nr:hypothetical protein [Planctomycetaceae bacterium]
MIQFYAYAEDAPSQAVLQKIIHSFNNQETTIFCFREGFPKIMNGFSKIKERLPACIEIGKNGLYSISLTDLDKEYCCPPSLIRNWLSIEDGKPIELPEKTLFRVAVREIESWIMADRKKFAKYFDLTESLLPTIPDKIRDPKKEFFSLLRKKERQKFRRMLPGKNSFIGPEYNDIMCDFIERHWLPTRAENNSPSLKRMMSRLRAIT